LLTITAVAFGTETIQQNADPVAAWVKMVEGQALCISLKLSKRTGEAAYQDLDFVSAARIEVGYLDGLHPGLGETLNNQRGGREDPALPVALLTLVNDTLIDVTTMIYSFDPTLPLL
jgi:hypothetical protein